jgi:V8-like Glu-specific endopeptidase
MPRLIVGLAVVASLAVGGTIAVAEVALAKPSGRAVADGTAAGWPQGSDHDNSKKRTSDVAGIVHVIGTAAQAAARSYWTSARMASATGSSAAGSGAAGSGAAGAGTAGARTTTAPAAERQDAVMGASAAQEPPRGTPYSKPFAGIPTVGALFYTKGKTNHFCTASVVHSTVGSLVLTAAHCVYSSKGGYSQNMEFIPGYEDGSQSYGAWPVTQITVAKGWRQSQNPDLDVAFLNVVPPPNSVGPIETVTGALQIAFALPDAQHITVIGYNDTDEKPIMCNTTSFKFRTDQMEFYCRGFWFGTSGGPWILDYNQGKGTGTVYGVIGGYEAGGYVPWASYSAALEKPAQQLLAQAEATAASAAASSMAKSSMAGKPAGTQITAAVG